MRLKPSLSTKELVALLVQRGMIIPNQADACEYLASHHYYRLNIYFHKLMDVKDHFPPGLEFQQIIDLYENDRWLRNRVLALLEPVEIKLRSVLCDYLGAKYGSDAFYLPDLYKRPEFHRAILAQFEMEVVRNASDPVIDHHRVRYGGKFPIWVILEFLSFNALSKFYGNCQEMDKKAMAKSAYGINDYLLGQWVHVLSVLRNVCAHYGYLYRREFSVRPVIERASGWDTSKNDSLFAVCLALKRLSTSDDWGGFYGPLVDAETSRPAFKLADYGFPHHHGDFLS